MTQMYITVIGLALVAAPLCLTGYLMWGWVGLVVPLAGGAVALAVPAVERLVGEALDRRAAGRAREGIIRPRGRGSVPQAGDR